MDSSTASTDSSGVLWSATPASTYTFDIGLAGIRASVHYDTSVYAATIWSRSRSQSYAPRYPALRYPSHADAGSAICRSASSGTSINASTPTAGHHSLRDTGDAPGVHCTSWIRTGGTIIAEVTAHASSYIARSIRPAVSNPSRCTTPHGFTPGHIPPASTRLANASCATDNVAAPKSASDADFVKPLNAGTVYGPVFPSICRTGGGR